MSTVAHVSQDVGCSKEVEDQRNNRLAYSIPKIVTKTKRPVTMGKSILLLAAAFGLTLTAVTVRASPIPTEEITRLVNDKSAAANSIQTLLNDVYKNENTKLIDNSTFSPYSSGDHRYLIAKAFVTFYNEYPRQRTLGILADVDSGWTFSITEQQLDYFVRTGDRTYLPSAPNLDPNQPDNAPPPVPRRSEEFPTPPRINPEFATPPTRVNDAAAFIIGLSQQMDNHNWRAVVAYSSGSINYFGRIHTSNDYIRNDMIGDANNYRWVHSTIYPDTFTREVSNEYSSKWQGPMIYDSITEYTQAQENNGRTHRATTRLTVGFTVYNDVITIYALVLKVLK